MGDRNTFVLSLTSRQFSKLREDKAHRISPFIIEKVKEVNVHDQVLVFLRDKFVFIAEYDIIDFKLLQKYTRFFFEPVYIAPPTNGVKANDVLLVQLSTYESVLEWQNMLTQELLDINARDYEIIVKKLML